MKNSDQRKQEVQIPASSGAPSGSKSREDVEAERTDKLAKGIERRFTEVLQWVYKSSDAEITRIDDGGEYLDLVFRMPFFLPEPYYEYGPWLATRSAQTKLRRGFMSYLQKREFVNELSGIFFTRLSQFLLELNDSSRYSESVQKYLRRIPQRMLAGRSHHPMDKNITKVIKKESVEIHRTIQDMQRIIGRWKRANSKIDEQTIRKKIERRYSINIYSWMPFFTSQIAKLPSKPLSNSKTDANEAYDQDAKLPPPKLSEPGRWSTIDITVKILQKQCLQRYALSFSLRDIKLIVGVALRKSDN